MKHDQDLACSINCKTSRRCFDFTLMKTWTTQSPSGCTSRIDVTTTAGDPSGVSDEQQLAFAANEGE
jgi:hypothetical protein